MDKLTLLETSLGAGVKTNRDYYQFHCPFCNHHKPKLGVSLGSGKWKCWVCGANGGKVTVLLNRIKADPSLISKAKNLFVETGFTNRESLPTGLTLPKEFAPLWVPDSSLFYKKAKSYLLGRGVTELDILKHKIGYCDRGKYRDMIIFPFYNDSGILTYFTARSYMPNPMFKFSAPFVDKDQVFDGNLVNWSEPIIVVESKLDSIIIRRNAVPQNGKQLTRSFLKRVLDEGVKVIYLCLDGDAVKDIMQYSTWFNDRGIEVRATEFPLNEEETQREGRPVYHDPTSLGYERVWYYIEHAKTISSTDGFKYNIINRLHK